MSVTVASTPAADGFRMPGEFRAHAGCWMAWPERGTSGGSRRGPRRRRSRRWPRRSAPASPSRWGSRTTCSRAAARCWRPRSGSSSCPPTTPGCATPDRPSCSTSAGARRGVDWHFNAWGGLQGGLYSPWDRDERVAAKVLEVERADRYRAPLVLEGGSIHCDGEGTVLTTEECLLNPNRNPGLDPGGDRAAAARVPRGRAGPVARARDFPTTRPTATSTTSPASSRPAACC